MIRIDLVDCADLVQFLVVTGKVRYPGILLYTICQLVSNLIKMLRIAEEIKSCTKS